MSLSGDLSAQENIQTLLQINLPCSVEVLSAVERGLRNVYGRDLRMRQVGDHLEITRKGWASNEVASVSAHTITEVERLKKHIKFIAGLLPDGEPGRLARDECCKALFPEMG